jgi:hypothetical protein
MGSGSGAGGIWWHLGSLLRISISIMPGILCLTGPLLKGLSWVWCGNWGDFLRASISMEGSGVVLEA